MFSIYNLNTFYLLIKKLFYAKFSLIPNRASTQNELTKAKSVALYQTNYLWEENTFFRRLNFKYNRIYANILIIEFSLFFAIEWVLTICVLACSSHLLSQYCSICIVHCLILYPFCAIVVAIFNISDELKNGSVWNRNYHELVCNSDQRNENMILNYL